MRVVAYGRVRPGGNEIPLSTQKHACQRFCEQNKIDLGGWWGDECEPETPLLNRDQFPEIVRVVSTQEVDGILVYELDRISTNPGIVAGLPALIKATVKEDITIYTPEGEQDLTESPDPEMSMVASAMTQVTDAFDEWQSLIKSFRIRESLHDHIEKGERSKIGRPPFGLESDRQRFENRDRVWRYYPDDQGDRDRFKVAIQILNEFAHADTDPWDTGTEPTITGTADKYDVTRSQVESVWKNQKTFREVAEEHRDDLLILF